jgi:hypothetical protein
MLQQPLHTSAHTVVWGTYSSAVGLDALPGSFDTATIVLTRASNHSSVRGPFLRADQTDEHSIDGKRRRKASSFPDLVDIRNPSARVLEFPTIQWIHNIGIQ